MTIPSIEEVVALHVEGGDPTPLVRALQEREDLVADALRLMGQQFGLYPEIVAEVLTNGVRLGTPVSLDQHAHVRERFIARMEDIRRSQQD